MSETQTDWLSQLVRPFFLFVPCTYHCAQSIANIYCFVIGDAIRMLTSTPVGTYLINTAVNRQTASRPDDALSIELPFPDAHQLLKSLKSLLSKEGQDLKKNGVDLDELKRISDQLDAQTSVIAKAGHISNKHIHVRTNYFHFFY
jgi:hypothetical protein